jgi:hypothetical protein
MRSILSAFSFSQPKNKKEEFYQLLVFQLVKKRSILPAFTLHPVKVNEKPFYQF